MIVTHKNGLYSYFHHDTESGQLGNRYINPNYCLDKEIASQINVDKDVRKALDTGMKITLCGDLDSEIIENERQRLQVQHKLDKEILGQSKQLVEFYSFIKQTLETHGEDIVQDLQSVIVYEIDTKLSQDTIMNDLQKQ